MSNENRERTLSKQTEFQQLKRAAVQPIGPPIKNESEEILSWYLKKKENTGNTYFFNLFCSKSEPVYILRGGNLITNTDLPTLENIFEYHPRVFGCS